MKGKRGERRDGREKKRECIKEVVNYKNDKNGVGKIPLRSTDTANPSSLLPWGLLVEAAA